MLHLILELVLFQVLFLFLVILISLSILIFSFSLQKMEAVDHVFCNFSEEEG